MPKKKNDLSQRLEAVIKTLVPQQEQNPDDLGPMMRAIKAVHSISDHTSTTPEDLERQRAGQELFARLVTPSIGIRNDSLTVGTIPAEWVSLEHGHRRGLLRPLPAMDLPFLILVLTLVGFGLVMLASASSMAAGKGCSGARRYSKDSTSKPVARASLLARIRA